MNSNLTIQRQQLRQQMRANRLALSAHQQSLASQHIIEPALALIEQAQASTIAFYLPFDNEISPIPLMKRLWQQGKKLYVPVLHPFSAHQLLFLAYQPDSKLVKNRFGIWQPKLDVRNVLPISMLKMMFLPLVACDKQGNRLGMGGGFYDRTLAQSPHLITVGLAHRCQQVEKLPIADWDMPLDHLIIGDCT